MSESVRNSDLPNMLDSQELFANTKKMTGLITEELKSRGYEPRELSDDQLRKVIQKAPKTANRLEQITDNVLRGELEMFIGNMQEGRSISDKDLMNILRSTTQEGRSISDKDVKTAEELFDQFAKPVGGGLEGILMGMVSPVNKPKQIANAPKFLKDLYDRRGLYMQMVDDSMRALKSVMGPSKGKTNSDDLFTRINADDFDLVQRQRVMDTAYKASRRKDELMNIERQIKSTEKALGNMGDIRKVDAADEVGKRFMAKSELSTGGLIDALKNIRNK